MTTPDFVPKRFTAAKRTVSFIGRRARPGDKASGCVVLREHADGSRSALPPRHDLRNHSPDGFNWGYGGSGPAQLALAVLAEVADDDTAQDLYQKFKWEVIAKLDGDHWTLPLDRVEAWLRRAGEGGGS